MRMSVCVRLILCMLRHVRLCVYQAVPARVCLYLSLPRLLSEYLPTIKREKKTRDYCFFSPVVSVAEKGIIYKD